MSKPLNPALSKLLDPASFAKNGSEHGNQVALFVWASQNFHTYPELRLMFAIPVGGKRDKITAANLRAEGARAGVPDICLPVPRSKYHGLFLELKIDKNKPSQEQYWYIAELRKQGFAADWVVGWELARDRILAYLEEKE